MGSTIEEIMRKRQREAQEAYEAMWANGAGSHHPDYDTEVPPGPGVVKASRATEELYNAIVKNDVHRVYDKIEEGADVNFVFGPAYSCPEGYTPLMVAAHRGRLECARALLRAGADPSYINNGGDSVLFWAIDGGPDMIRLMLDYGANPDVVTPRGWTALSYAVAKGKYGAVEDKGIYPEDVLLYYGAKVYGEGPPALGSRSPRNSFNPEDPAFSRERGSYQSPFPAP
ncbi:hypothetical protein PLESTB_000515500 [Pleodorina starrii]|uniref:Uncharacterized protein n=1 Tax=Pleodorina starrii TaxID=330485 RepID=A0A9W6BG80_9CHLO|nr:hypothetical protein PLESTM_000378400 [Pleodorina starrii]GLC51559.1 hypothetical protein PLESTB_000515500 [Pleodorina starrii]GLC72325.1 hypothetical protein PLESTF_001235500 [Pleodorina starrii]